MKEVWKQIKEFEGLYEVSNLGNVRSVDRFVNHSKGGKSLKKGKILKPSIGNGYLAVILSKNNILVRKNIHRLVAEAFIPNPYNLKQINHKDENKLNNIFTNLEWCDCKYNINYGSALNRMIQTKIDKGIVDPSHVGLPHKEQNRLINIKYRKNKTQD